MIATSHIRTVDDKNEIQLIMPIRAERTLSTTEMVTSKVISGGLEEETLIKRVTLERVTLERKGRDGRRGKEVKRVATTRSMRVTRNPKPRLALRPPIRPTKITKKTPIPTKVTRSSYLIFVSTSAAVLVNIC